MRPVARLWEVRQLPASFGRQVAQRSTAASSAAQESSEDVKPASAIPGPKAHPIMGTMLQHRPGAALHDEDILKVGFRMFEKYGPIVREKLLPNWPWTHVFYAEDIEKVYRNEGSYPWRMPFEVIAHYRKRKGVSIGLVQVQGKEWLRIRGQVQTHMLRPRSVTTYLPEQAAVTDDLVTRVRRLRDNSNYLTDFVSELNHWAMESIGVVCFNTRAGALEPDLTFSREAKEFVEAAKGVFKYVNDSWSKLPIYKIYRDKKYLQFEKHMDVLWSLSKKHIDLTEERAKRGELGGTSGKDNLLLSLLSRPNLSRDEAYVLINDLFFGGVETTAYLLAFSLFNIATNPRVQRVLQEEIDEKLPRGVPLTENAFDKLPYLKAVVKETNRVTPVAPSNIRKLEKDIVIQGYNVPAGDYINTWSGVSSMLPRYFDDPETFLPERWLRNSQSREMHPFAMLPFGFGPRMCIGRRFAEQEVYLGITKLLQEFNIEHNEGFIGMKTNTINMPAKPLNLRLVNRV